MPKWVKPGPTIFEQALLAHATAEQVKQEQAKQEQATREQAVLEEAMSLQAMLEHAMVGRAESPMLSALPVVPCCAALPEVCANYLHLWKCSYVECGLVTYRSRVVRWPCVLDELTFEGLCAPVACGGVTVPAFVAASERRVRHVATDHALRAAIIQAVSFMGFGRSALSSTTDFDIGPPLPAQRTACTQQIRTAMCDCFAALLAHYSVVVYANYFFRLPADFRDYDEVDGHADASGWRSRCADAAQLPLPSSSSTPKASARTRAYFRRMHEAVRVREVNIPRFIVETSRWVRAAVDSDHARCAAMMRDFAERFGVRGAAAARIAAAAEAAVEAEDDLGTSILDLLDDADSAPAYSRALRTDMRTDMRTDVFHESSTLDADAPALGLFY